MTRDDIICMAQECQLIGMRPHLDGLYEEALQRFAALVAAAEREACAKVCEQLDEDGEGPDCWGWHSKDYAKAIRTRQEPPR